MIDLPEQPFEDQEDGTFALGHSVWDDDYVLGLNDRDAEIVLEWTMEDLSWGVGHSLRHEAGIIERA